MFNHPTAARVFGLDSPAPAPMVADLSHVTDAREVFPEPRPGVRALSTFEKLAAIRSRMQTAGAAPEQIRLCDQLLVDYSALEKTIEKFLHEYNEKHVTTLAQKRADLWAKCRTAETAARSAVFEIGRLNSQINSQAAAVNGWRNKATDAAIRPFDTSFPTREELDEWNAKRVAVGIELANHETRLQEIRRAAQFAEVERHEASQELARVVEELRVIDAELNAAQK
jgi:hypothetical protein